MEFHKSKGQHILRNPLVVQSIVDKAGEAAAAGTLCPLGHAATACYTIAPAWLLCHVSLARIIAAPGCLPQYSAAWAVQRSARTGQAGRQAAWQGGICSHAATASRGSHLHSSTLCTCSHITAHTRAARMLLSTQAQHVELPDPQRLPPQLPTCLPCCPPSPQVSRAQTSCWRLAPVQVT